MKPDPDLLKLLARGVDKIAASRRLLRAGKRGRWAVRNVMIIEIEEC